MRIRSCLITVALFAPCAAGAQTTTADGVQALIRGDYQMAARILRPLAEDAPQPDALAQFFMAMLYDSGKGVARNPIRACGLYLSAAAAANPLMNQSFDLAHLIQMEYGPRDAQRCAASSARGWQDAPWGLFTLGQDHSLTFDQTGVTVSYKGTQNHSYMEMGGPGFVYLPVRLTQLSVLRPVDARRHFIEFFFWQPDDANPPTWTLAWVLYEVSGSDFIFIMSDERLMTNTAPRPTTTSVDVANAARVQVNPNGEAEWVLPGGLNPRRGVIPFRGPR